MTYVDPEIDSWSSTSALSWVKEKKMCETVIAYKSTNGALHTSKEACERENTRIKKVAQESKINGIFYSRFQAESHNNRELHYRGMSIDYATSILARDWKIIRDALNSIEEIK